MSSNEATPQFVMHSQRPWSTSGVVLLDAHGNVIGGTAPNNDFGPRALANAALIVRSVNSHDALVEAVRNLRIALVRCADKGESPRGQVAQHAIEMADAALKALAEMREAR